MRLLLDSQAFIHLVRDPKALPRAARAAIEDARNEVYLSIASPLEIQIKVNLGKLTLVRSVSDAVQLELDRGSLRLLPITLAHPFPHRLTTQ